VLTWTIPNVAFCLTIASPGSPFFLPDSPGCEDLHLASIPLCGIVPSSPRHGDGPRPLRRVVASGPITFPAPARRVPLALTVSSPPLLHYLLTVDEGRLRVFPRRAPGFFPPWFLSLINDTHGAVIDKSQDQGGLAVSPGCQKGSLSAGFRILTLTPRFSLPEGGLMEITLPYLFFLPFSFFSPGPSGKGGLRLIKPRLPPPPRFGVPGFFPRFPWRDGRWALLRSCRASAVFLEWTTCLGGGG